MRMRPCHAFTCTQLLHACASWLLHCCYTVVGVVVPRWVGAPPAQTKSPSQPLCSASRAPPPACLSLSTFSDAWPPQTRHKHMQVIVNTQVHAQPPPRPPTTTNLCVGVGLVRKPSALSDSGRCLGTRARHAACCRLWLLCGSKLLRLRPRAVRRRHQQRFGLRPARHADQASPPEGYRMSYCGIHTRNRRDQRVGGHGWAHGRLRARDTQAWDFDGAGPDVGGNTAPEP